MHLETHPAGPSGAKAKLWAQGGRPFVATSSNSRPRIGGLDRYGRRLYLCDEGNYYYSFDLDEDKYYWLS
jgi:hypothetical protein